MLLPALSALPAIPAVPAIPAYPAPPASQEYDPQRTHVGTARLPSIGSACSISALQVRTSPFPPFLPFLLFLPLPPMLANPPSPPRSSKKSLPSASGITWTHENAALAGTIPAQIDGSRLRVSRLRQRRLDGHLPGEQRTLRFLSTRRAAQTTPFKNNRDGTFTDVTDKAGVAGGSFGMGVAAGDYDNDGFPDLFVTAYGRRILYHNNGNGTFTDVTEKAGVGAPGGRQRRLVRLRQRRSARSFCLQLRPV